MRRFGIVQSGKALGLPDGQRQATSMARSRAAITKHRVMDVGSRMYIRAHCLSAADSKKRDTAVALSRLSSSRPNTCLGVGTCLAPHRNAVVDVVEGGRSLSDRAASAHMSTHKSGDPGGELRSRSSPVPRGSWKVCVPAAQPSVWVTVVAHLPAEHRREVKRAMERSGEKSTLPMAGITLHHTRYGCTLQGEDGHRSWHFLTR